MSRRDKRKSFSVSGERSHSPIAAERCPGILAVLALNPYRREPAARFFPRKGGPERSATVRLLLLSAICLSLLATSCAEEPSTQIVVLMDTDYEVPAEVDQIRARVSKIVPAGDGAEQVETWLNVFSVSDGTASDSGVHALPATFGILRSGSDLDREIVIELEALDSGSGRALVSRRVKTGFVSGEARLARMLLFSACADIVCSPGESCGCPGAASCAAPSCVDEVVRPEDLERIENPGFLPADAGIPTQDAGLPDGGEINCEAPLMLCAMNCVNPQADPRYCGDCDTSCPTGHVCDGGSCMDPGDCRSIGVDCSGFTYCDESSGECLPGCTEAQQCNGDHEVCDTDIHDCICAPGFERCEGVCVDTQIDPNFCGDCSRSCPIGEVCEAGMCLDLDDCRNNDTGCSGFTYCDQATGECLRGCEVDVQCVGENETCDTVAHECVCATGFHQCGAVCVSDSDVNTCGASCTPCLAPPNATAACNLGACDFICDETYEPCDQMCCRTSCPPGQALYDGVCGEIHLQIVDETGNIGSYSALALDAAGRAHIAYYASSGRDLAHAAQQLDDSWSLERPDGADEVGQHTSIAFDPNGVLHIAYYNASDKDLMLATKQADGVWTVDVVDGEGDVGQHTSLAFDSAGDPHISYYDSGNGALLHATRQSGGGWAVEVVDSDGNVGRFTSLAFDPSGVAHISYYDVDGKDLKHATQETDGSWRTQTVASDGDVGKYTSLAFDATGVTHISYYSEGTGKDLLYATEWAGVLWFSETVDSEADVGKYTSLAFDATGGARISYYDENARDLKYAVRAPGQPWALQSVDTVGDVGRYTSIAVDDLGQAHISYYDATGTNLKYALIAAPE